MKKQKFLLIIFSVLFIIPILVTPISASGSTATVSEDYSEISYNGYTYERVHSKNISNINNARYINDLKLSENEEQASYIIASANEYAIELEISYSDGAYVTYYYIREDKLTEYNNTLENGGDLFIYSYSNGLTANRQLSISHDELYTTRTTVKGYEAAKYLSIVHIDQTALDGNVRLSSRGYIFKDENGKFYFLDYYQSGLEPYDIYLAEAEEVVVYEITDTDLIAAVGNTSNEYYYTSEEYTVGFFIFSIIVSALILGILPFIASIVCFILGFIVKKGYKRFFFTISLLCLTASVLSFITVILSIIFLLI